MDDLRYQIDLLTAINQKLNNNERMYKLICETSQRAFIYINYINKSISVLGKWDTFFDFTINDINELGTIADAFMEDYRSELIRLISLEKEGKTSATYEACLKDDKTWISINAGIYTDDSGNITDKIITFMDITKDHNQREELTYLAYYDFLTNLYSRNYFITKLKGFVEKAEKNNCIVSVMIVDVDDFHKISDTRGIVIGDEVIQNIGLFLQSMVEPNIIASHFDSDIFCLAIYDPCGHRSVDTVYRSIKDYLSHPIRLTDGSDVNVSVTIGVAEYPEASEDALSLINCAEVVMLKAKGNGKDNIKFFDSVILNNFLRDVKIENKLKEAVHLNNFYMNYQPQFYSDSRRLRGVEALVRWKDKDGIIVSPSVFIPIAEKNGTIIPIGDFVIDESIKTFMDWKKKFEYDMTLSINISSIQYNRADFVPKIISAISKYQMNPEELELEITESVLIDDLKLVTAKMLELRDYGIKVSLDDFGTGFSSLSYLRGLPIDTLKIDKSFIDNIITDESSKVIASTIISMSKKLGFTTVAEGVETKEQLEYLNEISCDLIQGYYLGKPLEASQVEELLLRLI